MALWYKGANHAADIVLVSGTNEDASIALIQRKGEPFRGCFAFPGGFVDTNATPGAKFSLDIETPLQAAMREAQEEISVDLSSDQNIRIEPIGVYDDPARDPRNTTKDHVVSNAFLFIVPEELPLKAEDDAATAQWIPLKDVLESRVSLAFDHSQILNDAFEIMGIESRIETSKPKKEYSVVHGNNHDPSPSM